jgi:hypothetical protein
VSRRVAVLMAAAGMAVLMGALAGVAWAEGGCGTLCGGGAPTVVSTVPPNGALDVDPNANNKAMFSEAMKAKSINTNTFYLEAGAPCGTCSTTRVPATVRYNHDTKTAVLNPTDPLAPDTTYTATVKGTGDGDMQAVKDRGGTPLASDYTFSFTTSVCGAC